MPSLRRYALVMLAAIGIAMAWSTLVLAQVTPPWSNATTNTGTTGDFDTGTLSFGGIAGQTILILNPAGGYYHDHTGGCSSTLEVHLNGNWTLVHTGPVSNGNDQPLATLHPPHRFPPGIVDRVRLGSTCEVGDAYHEINDAMQFQIVAGETIPTLSELALLVLAALTFAAGGLALRRSQGR